MFRHQDWKHVCLGSRVSDSETCVHAGHHWSPRLPPNNIWKNRLYKCLSGMSATSCLTRHLAMQSHMDLKKLAGMLCLETPLKLPWTPTNVVHGNLLDELRRTFNSFWIMSSVLFAVSVPHHYIVRSAVDFRKLSVGYLGHRTIACVGEFEPSTPDWCYSVEC
jgi:hypothetical protein